MKPDADQIYRRLDLHFAEIAAEYGGQIELGAKYPDGDWTPFLANCNEEGFALATKWAVSKNEGGANIYFAPNPRPSELKKAASDSDIEIAFWNFADLDKSEAADIVVRNNDLPLQYTYAVRTGTAPDVRGHVYWKLEYPVRNMDAFRRTQQGIQVRVKGDDVYDPSRKMRLAGTVSYPSKKKMLGGYKTELTVLRADKVKERGPIDPETLRTHYPWLEKPLPHHLNDNVDELWTEAVVAQPNGSGLGLVPPRVKDPDAAVEARIAANDNWDNAVTKMVARLMADGLSAEEVIDRAAEAYTTDGYTLEQTRREVSAKVRRVAKKYETGQWVRPQLKVVQGETDEIVDLGIRPVGLLQPLLRKKREFLVPNRFMRKHVTLTSAAPGVGKSTLAIEEAIALASGRDFLNLGFDETKPMRAAIINNEETSDEIERRIEATCQCFDVPLESIAENLFVRSGVDAEKLVAARMIDGEVVATPHRRALKQFVQDAQLDLLIIDPFVQSHAVSENANEAVSRAMVLLRECVVGDEHSAAL